jgi:hypothetical protein
MQTFKIIQVEQDIETEKLSLSDLFLALNLQFFRAILHDLIFELKNNFSGKLFQSLLLSWFHYNLLGSH